MPLVQLKMLRNEENKDISRVWHSQQHTFNAFSFQSFWFYSFQCYKFWLGCTLNQAMLTSFPCSALEITWKILYLCTHIHTASFNLYLKPTTKSQLCGNTLATLRMGEFTDFVQFKIFYHFRKLVHCLLLAWKNPYKSFEFAVSVIHCDGHRDSIHLTLNWTIWIYALRECAPE